FAPGDAGRTTRGRTPGGPGRKFCPPARSSRERRTSPDSHRLQASRPPTVSRIRIMWRFLCCPVAACLLLLAPPLLGTRSAAAHGGGMCSRNDLKIPVVVQGASVVNNMVRRGKPVVLAPGKTGWDTNLPAGSRVVTVYDYFQTNRILFQGTYQFNGSN